MTRISKNFTLEEMTASDTAKARGILNIPDVQQMCNLCALVHNVLQPLRNHVGSSISLNSAFRCRQLNSAVGGVSTSQHMKGEAADIDIQGNLTRGKEWFQWIRSHCTFDQLIWEHNKSGTYWIHVSYCSDGRNRKQVIDNLLKR